MNTPELTPEQKGAYLWRSSVRLMCLLMGAYVMGFLWSKIPSDDVLVILAWLVLWMALWMNIPRLLVWILKDKIHG